MKLPAFTPSRACLAAAGIVVVFLLAGAIGHDPWKPDEAYSFGLVLHILDTGHWVVPMLAGEPFMEKPPLYYLTAAASARLFSPWLALHDGARLASAFYVGLAALLAGLAARRFFGPGHGHRAALLLVGSFALAPHAHEMITDTALLAGFALAILGLAFVQTGVRDAIFENSSLTPALLAGGLLGTGVGIGFMSKGLVEPAMMASACLMLFAFRRFRSRAYLACLAWALLFALPWLTLWPVLLYRENPALFGQWLWENNFGRYFGFVRLGAKGEPWFFTRTLPWFTFPVGVVALGAAIAGWRRADDRFRAALEINAAVVLGIVVVLGTSSSARALYAMPLLLPLAILGSSVVHRVPARVGLLASGLLAVVTLGALALAWWIWSQAFASGGMLPPVDLVNRWLPSDFEFPFEPEAVAAAAAITIAWLALWGFRRVSWLHLWSANVTAIWGVYMVLLLPWFDDAKSFREPFEDLGEHVVNPARCVASIGLGEPERAMLLYVAGITTARREVDRRQCRYLVMQSTGSGPMPALPEGEWDLLWEGGRPGERREHFQLWESPRIEARYAEGEEPAGDGEARY